MRRRRPRDQDEPHPHRHPERQAASPTRRRSTATCSCRASWRLEHGAPADRDHPAARRDRAPAESLALAERALLRHAGAAREARVGVGASLRMTTRPSRSSGTSPPSSEETRATTDRSADRRRPTGPRRRRAGRATGTARPQRVAVPAPSRARRRTCPAPGPRRVPTRRARSRGAQRSRKSHLRRDASSSVTSRSGRASASGMPGEPPPEPTSTIGPSSARTRSIARSASSTSIARASASSRSDVSPGVASTAASHASVGAHMRTSSCQSRPPTAEKSAHGRPGAAPSYTVSHVNGEAATAAPHVSAVQ